MEDDDNVIKLQNFSTVHIPEVQRREGTVTLHYGGDKDEESIEIKGSITLSEVCFLYMILGKFIQEELDKG